MRTAGWDDHLAVFSAYTRWLSSSPIFTHHGVKSRMSVFGETAGNFIGQKFNFTDLQVSLDNVKSI